VIPVGYPGEVQVLKVLTRNSDGSCSSRDVIDVAFVPLTRLRDNS
jgi:protein-L-isoaspartate O-methyltransferase